ncbi:hypothetical protein ACPA9J_24490 [Pseudomonas aeruginosa]
MPHCFWWRLGRIALNVFFFFFFFFSTVGVPQRDPGRAVRTSATGGLPGGLSWITVLKKRERLTARCCSASTCSG